jgi:NADP-dependent 3-hydroxy acid dehydrogenase YdfG
MVRLPPFFTALANPAAEQNAFAGRECILIPQDIRDEQGCNRIIETVVQKWGRIDILVNNASVMYDTPSITGKQGCESSLVVEMN